MLSKRSIDVILVLVTAPFSVPLVILLAFLVSLDGGPMIFGHRRVGRGNKDFHCWKLRTMVPNAQALLAAKLLEHPHLQVHWDREHKLDDDFRITRLGRFLRASSLDELPQLWNVLCGDMSLIGPRPVPRCELVKYRGSAWSYLSMRPGITGLWQTSGRNNVSYDERVSMDVTYTQTVSMLGDIAILIRTVGAVLARTGR